MIDKNLFQQQNYEVIANKINKNSQNFFEKILNFFLLKNTEEDWGKWREYCRKPLCQIGTENWSN